MTAYERLVRFARERAEALGLVLSGSRGRGEGRDGSDWDCYLIVADGAHVEDAVATLVDDSIDLTLMSLRAFRDYASPGTEEAWDAYAFAHVVVDYDGLEGEIRSIAAAKEYLAEAAANERACRSLDAYINAAVRSAQSRRDGRAAAALLDGAEAVAFALETLFAAEGRIRPYNRYVGWELERHPLATSSVPRDLQDLAAAALAGDDDAARRLFTIVEATASAAGLTHVISAWDEDQLRLARSPRATTSHHPG